jgi:hypothetical protein
MDATEYRVTALRLRRIRLLNEIAFLHGDRAHGGPQHETEIDRYRGELAEIDHILMNSCERGI